MSQLSFMEKLLDGVEVEWKKLGDMVILPNLRHLINRIKLPDLVFVSA